MSQIHILDGQTDTILDYIQADNIVDDSHKKSLEDTLETFDFIAFADKSYTQYLEKRNRVIIPDEDGTYREFIMFEVAKYRDTEGLKVQVFSHASYLELKKSNVIYPNTFKGTISQHAGRALNKTGWQVGTVEGEGDKTISINEHTSPYENLRRIAKEFDVELRFRVETDGSKITGRYVDFLERIGEWRGREVEFGKDLVGIRRVEKQDIVTALLGLGPEREDGTRLEVLVEDYDALQRWGWYDEHGNLNHYIEPYEIQSERSEMTETEARRYTRTALNKRINTQVTYECEIADLEQVKGLEHEKIRFGDTIKIKDTEFNPPLYVEARVFEQERSIVTNEKKSIKLGDYIEYTEEEVHSIWEQLKKQIQNRVSYYEMVEYTYDKLTIDTKDETVFEEGKSFAEATGIQAEENAKAFAVEEDKKIKLDVEQYADTVAQQQANSALEQAKMYSVSKTVYENQMNQIAQDMADKADLEYVDGQLVSKANKGDVYTIEDVDNMINNTVSKTQYETDKEGIVTELESQGTRIGQNEQAIGLKADRTELNQVENSLSTQIANVEIKADQVTTRVESVEAEVEGLGISDRNLVLDSAKGIKKEGLPVNGNQQLIQARAYSFSVPIGGGKTYSVAIKAKGVGELRPYVSGTYLLGSFALSDEYKVFTNVITTSSYESLDLDLYGVNVTDFEIDWIKVVESNVKISDWSPAPEDNQEEINGLKGRVNTAEGEIRTLAGEVSLKASQSTVDSLEQRVSTAEGELQVLPGQINAKVSKDGVIGAINATPERLLIDFDKVKMTGELEAKHIKSLAGLNVNDQFIVDNSGNVKFSGNLQGASGTFGDVTVTDGDFNLQDEVTGNKYSATPRRNLLKDHSFEMVREDGDTLSTTYNWCEMLDTHPYFDSPWYKVGSPKVAMPIAPSSQDGIPTFGRKAIVVRDANYVRQYVDGVASSTKYTVSAFFKRQWKVASGGIPRIEIWHTNALGDRVAKLVNATFSSVKSDYSVSRHSTTFVTPSSFGIFDSLEVIISGGNDRWIQCDGVQMVEGDRASVYQPEDSVWEIHKGQISPINRMDVLWQGEVYPTGSQTVRPEKNIYECRNGWLLQWQRYVKGSGTGNNNYNYSVIPKAHAEFQGGAGIKLVLARGYNTIYKYIYVHYDKIVGADLNSDENRHELALTAVYEW